MSTLEVEEDSSLLSSAVEEEEDPEEEERAFTDFARPLPLPFPLPDGVFFPAGDTERPGLVDGGEKQNVFYFYFLESWKNARLKEKCM